MRIWSPARMPAATLQARRMRDFEFQANEASPQTQRAGVDALALACLEPRNIVPAGNSVCFAAPKQVTHCRSYLQVANSGPFWQIRSVPFFHNERG